MTIDINIRNFVNSSLICKFTWALNMSNRYRFQSNGSCFEVFGKFGRDYVFCVTEYPFVEYVEVIAQGTPTGSKVVYAIFNVLDKESLTQQLSRHYGQNISLIEF